MKNWFKAFCTPEVDILALRDFDEEEMLPSIVLRVEYEPGCAMEASLCYPSHESRDKAFEHLTEEGVLEIFKGATEGMPFPEKK